MYCVRVWQFALMIPSATSTRSSSRPSSTVVLLSLRKPPAGVIRVPRSPACVSRSIRPEASSLCTIASSSFTSPRPPDYALAANQPALYQLSEFRLRPPGPGRTPRLVPVDLDAAERLAPAAAGGQARA